MVTKYKSVINIKLPDRAIFLHVYIDIHNTMFLDYLVQYLLTINNKQLISLWP